MDISFRKVENGKIILVDQDKSTGSWQPTGDWVDIRAKDRKEVIQYFKDHELYKELYDCIEFPESYPFSTAFGEVVVLNISISNAADIYKTDYISIISINDLIISIIPKGMDLFSAIHLDAFSQKVFASLRVFIFNVIAVKILSDSNINMSKARSRLQRMEHLMDNEPEEISPLDLMSCERDIIQLSDIIEDQYVGFEILASIATINHRKESIEQTTKLIKAFEPLDKATQRLEKKAESLRVQFMLIQQEKATRKINTLTIIQAIFVPLTFIAGVYGMNFVNIPELNWPYGYLLVWLVFVGLASGLLIYFYRKGWFD